MPINSQYITDEQFTGIMNDLNVELDSTKDQDLIDRSEGDLEAALCERFQVPLVAANGGDLSTAPKYTQQKIKNAMRAKVRSNLAIDKNRNLVFEDNQRFINLHQKEFTDHIKELVDPAKVYGLKLTEQAAGSMEPVQKLVLGRHDDATQLEPDPWI